MMLERAAVSRETLIFHWPVMQFITQMMQEWSQSGEANHPIICIQIKMEFFLCIYSFEDKNDGKSSSKVSQPVPKHCCCQPILPFLLLTWTV